ncbi:MAG: hypothetical protein K6E70_08735, partial [Butyrivibrio sp.]|nr:hypothetical protein [Butyrivibrio sp.]
RCLRYEYDERIVAWFDRNSDFYSQNGMDVISSKLIEEYDGKIDDLIIAVTDKHIADDIRGYLEGLNCDLGRIRWLSDDFVLNCESDFEWWK